MSHPPASAGEGCSGDLFELCSVRKLTTIEFVGGIFCHICQLTFSTKKEFDIHYKQHNSDSSDIMYTCVICHKEITGYPSFRGHCYNRHVVKHKFKCQHCGKLFSKQTALQDHIDVKHIYKCSICKLQLPTYKEMNLHKFIHKSEKNKPPYKCLSCNYNITNNEECEDHIDQHSEISYSCPICNEHIPDKQTASEHLAVHFGYSCDDLEIKDDYELVTNSSIDVVGGIMCIYCKGIQRNKSEFLGHHCSEHGDKKIFYTCCICLKQHEKYENFADHCYNHTSKEKNQCELCDKKFDRLVHLVLHMEAFHAVPGDKPFICNLCRHGFQTEWWLKRHLRSIHDIHTLTCPEPGCGERFGKPGDLILHQKTHKNMENSCNICGLQFISMSACHRHLDLHCKTVFSCPICNKKYAEKYLAKKHIVHHFEFVIHMCNVCGKTFNYKHRLSQHMKVHSAARSHTCSYCGKAFTRAPLLQQHVNIHLISKPFKCSHCPKTFAGYPNLKKHLRRMHNVEGKLRDLIDTDSINDIPPQVANVTKNNNNNYKTDVTDMEPTMLNDQILDDMSVDTANSDGGCYYNSFENSFEELPAAQSEIKLERNQQSQLDDISFTNDDLINFKNAVLDTNLSLVNDPSYNIEFGTLTPPSSQISEYPPEYGPEFTDLGDPLSSFNSELSYSELVLPHIDPHLTTKNMFEQNLPYDFQIEFFQQKMENNLPTN